MTLKNIYIERLRVEPHLLGSIVGSVIRAGSKALLYPWARRGHNKFKTENTVFGHISGSIHSRHCLKHAFIDN